ncbi:MAG: YhfC family intramembrane metalloprotease [Clostridiales bacterium]|jgi:uncharacterized membrane protein YhfC|nr:YhfC family intramembrane metalloprotease [Clostridiales bacterium]
MITPDFTIPSTTIIAMIASIIVLSAFVITVSILLMRRYLMNLSAIILGLLMYIAFDTILLSIFDALIIGELSAAVRDFIYSDSWRYTVYFALVNTLFYIAGFSVTQRAAMNSDTGVGTGVAVGIGAAGSYVLLGTVYPLVNNVIASFEINKIGSQEFLAQAVESNREGMINAVEALSSSSGLEFLVTGYEKLMMYVILLAASTILYLAISHRSNFSYMFLVFGMMFLIFIPPALFSSGLISSPIVLELLMTVGAAGFVSVAIWHVSKYGENPLKF